MQSNSSTVEETPLILFARKLGRSWLASPITLLVSAAVAYAVWTHRESAGTLLTLFIIGAGLDKAWRQLPIPAQTRARWKQVDEVAKEHPAYPFRFFLWFGPLYPWLHSAHDGQIRWPGWQPCIEGLLSAIIGALCIVVSHRYARRKLAGRT